MVAHVFNPSYSRRWRWENVVQDRLGKSERPSQVLVAHACNPSYFMRQRSGGSRFKASLGKHIARPYLKKKPITKKGWWSGSKFKKEKKVRDPI
jgi:hypothetical protein